MGTDVTGTPRGPATYVIDYTPGNTINDERAEFIRASPPDILHHGHDVPLNNLWGPTKGLSAWEPDHAGGPADVTRKIEQLKPCIERLHELGVGSVIPYINPSIIGGTPAGEPSGPAAFFHFWQRRPEFPELGLDAIHSHDPRFETDPLDWMQRGPMSFAPYKEDCPYNRYEPCLRREPWLRFVEKVVELVSEAGYDGVFSDDDLVSCYCPVCQRDFQRFLEQEYADRLHEITRIAPLSEILPYSDDGKGVGPAAHRFETGNLSDGPIFGENEWATLIWQASQAFWSQTIADMLVRLREAGRKRNPRFFVVANWGMSRATVALGQRRRLGHDVRRWLEGATWQMLEEDGSAGYIAPGLVADFWTPCRVVAAYGAEPALLPYTHGSPEQMALVHAEAASVGCGALVGQGSAPELSAAYRAFYNDRRELFDGAVPYAPVRIYYSFDEIQRNNDGHLRLFYATARALGRCHIPFDVITREQLIAGGERDAGPQVIVNPGATDLPRTGDLPVIEIGPRGTPASEVLAEEEIELDTVFSLSRIEQEEALGRLAGVNRRSPDPLAELVGSALGRDAALTSSPGARDVRFRTFTLREAKRLVIHVVNYGWSSAAPGIPAPGQAPALELAVPEAYGGRGYRLRTVESAWTEAPGQGRIGLPINDSGSCPTLATPPTDAYRIVVVQHS